MNMMKMCLNWKVLAGLAAVGVGIWAVAPGTLAAALPLLLLAACPLSMAIMAFGMRGMASRGEHAGSATGAGSEYTCPMHPRVQSASRGRCPQCGMVLVPTPAAARDPAPPHRLRALQSQLERAQAEQQALSQELEALQREQGVEAAEAVASNTSRRTHGNGAH